MKGWREEEEKGEEEGKREKEPERHWGLSFFSLYVSVSLFTVLATFLLAPEFPPPRPASENSYVFMRGK